jgi:hypothetical protein
MKHDELQNDLAAHLGGSTDRMVWTNMQLGPAGSPRPDVFTVAKSFARFAADAYEIKVSVSDLRRDTTSGKWQSYRPFAHRVWFAFETGLVPLAEIPRDCGVILRSPTGWRSARKPISQVLDQLPRDAWIKLLLEAGQCHRIDPRQRHMSEWRATELARRKFGDLIGDALESRGRAEGAFARETARLEGLAEELRTEYEVRHKRADEEDRRSRDRLDEALLSLGDALGLRRDQCDAGGLTRALYAMRNRLEGHNLPRAIADLQALHALLVRPQGDSPAGNDGVAPR